MLIKTKFEGYARDGIRLYPCDDGGDAAPTTQTQISELPEWAKGYAKDTLAKTGALTDINQNPYQTYGANRIAGFNPTQTAAQKSAANMTTSAGTDLGLSQAGAATAGALGTKYDPSTFTAGKFGQADASAYMSPYMQSVVDVQQREAGRAADIATQGRNAQATGAGAFGGSRQAIMDAEAGRNLAMQKGDIQAQGLQSAFGQAQQQFNADQSRNMQAQQLGEQSKQYGAGLGLQGLQTALQGAGQLGALGGQKFGQAMDINKLQSAYGGQEQALTQRGLDQGYQDFQNQQNYPYKQLGFMSDMIRGLPLGQQSTKQMYEPPGSIAGQMAGIGTGLYGLSKFMAEGGSVNSYADGGSVDSQQNVANIVRQLSNDQLKQALKAAQARNDMDQIEAIQREMAERASMSQGLASIPMDHEAMMPDEAVGMANGGIVAFSDGGDIERYLGGGLLGGTMDGFETSPETVQAQAMSADEQTRASNDQNRLKIIESLEQKAKFLDTAAPDQAPAVRKQLEAFKASGASALPSPAAPKPVAAKPVAPKVAEKKTAPEVKKEFKKEEVKKAASPAAINKSIEKIAEETGVPKKTLMEQFDEIQKKFSSNNEATNDILKKAEEKLAGRSEEIKNRGLSDALVKFGFNMAAKASKPGARFLSSAAEASSSFGESLADTRKLQMAAEDNLAKMQIDRAKYDQAMQKQDAATASALLTQIRQGEHNDATLKEQIAQNKRKNDLDERQLSITAAYQNKVGTPEIFRIADQLKARGFKGTDAQLMAEAERLKNTGITERGDLANAGKVAAEVTKSLGDNTNYKIAKMSLIGAKTDAERAAIQQKIDEIERTTEADVRRRLNLGSQAGAAAPPQNLAKLGYQLVE